MKPSRIDLVKYVTVPVWYGCNNNCVICMLSGIKKELPFIDLDLFHRVLVYFKEKLDCENLILSGRSLQPLKIWTNILSLPRLWMVQEDSATDEREKIERQEFSQASY
jgi:hypothetical protein